MIKSKHINCIIAIFMVVAVLFTTLILLFPEMRGASDAAEPEYVGKVFNKDEVTQINIDMRQEDFDWIIENATKEEYRNCDLTINGATFKNVGIRPKGNSSLRTVAGDKNTDRFSFKIKFDQYVEGQTCFGLNKLALNNIIMDKTYMKEYLSYDMFESMGVVTPKYAYADITLNGQPWGLYLAVEVMEESFVQRNYGSLNGRLYRPEGAGADLKWTGENASNYSGIRNYAAYDVTDSDFSKVITMIYNLNNGTDLEKYLDVDSILRYFAVNTFLVNFDSYAGRMKHNYYLYEENGVFTILPWDFNLSFAGHEINNAASAVNFPIDTPVTTALSERPLIGKLLEAPEYKELYHKYLREIVASYFDSGLFKDKVQKVDALIKNYVKDDATAFYTYEQYQNALPVLLEFGKQRAASITAQLAGALPSTSSQQSNNTPNQGAISAGIDLNALGGMGGMGGGIRGVGGEGGRPGNAERGVPGGEGARLGGGIRDNNRDFPNLGGGAFPGDQNNNGAPPPNDVGGPPRDGNMPNQENMAEIIEIMQNIEGGELSNEQVARLKELGLDDNMMERMKNMPAGMRPDRGVGGFGNGPGNMRNGPMGDNRAGSKITPLYIGYVSAGTVFILLGLLFVWRFKKRKYSSR